MTARWRWAADWFRLLLVFCYIPFCTSQRDWYCGVNFADARKKCLTHCPTGAGCPEKESCFADTHCAPSDDTMSWPKFNGNGKSMPQVISTGTEAVEETLLLARDAINDKLFLYETPTSDWLPSTVYRFEGFFDGLRVMHQVGVAGKKIYMGGDCAHCHMYGLVNIAAFLAQAMKETIRYDACDENSWDRVGDLLMYPLSNACGQLGQSYQDYHCSEDERHMECTVDPEMTITAVTHAKWYGAPGPLKCGPKSVYPQTGYWDYAYECNNRWANPPESCDEYEGQRAGKAINDKPYPNAAGRTDVEGCCWWGRGVIQTSGICNFGKLNYYLGRRAFLEGRESRYPDIDFCRDPEAICTSQEFKELKWIAGFFYWIDQVQPYDRDGWNYLKKLHEFVEGGMRDERFINSVSGIVNRGCHNPPCGTGDLDGGPERAENFQRVLNEVSFSFVDVTTTPRPTSLPAPAPVETPESLPTPVLQNPVVEPAEVAFSCADSQSDESGSALSSLPLSTEVVFDYEIHSFIDVTVGHALKEVKGSILSDVAERMGCTETINRRKLEDIFRNIVGIRSSRTDMPDPRATGCVVEVDMNYPTSCAPVSGSFTLYAKPGTPQLSLDATGDYLKSIIHTSMDAGRYESDVVAKAVYIGDRNVFKVNDSSQPPPPPSPPTPAQVIIQSEPPNHSNDSLKVALASVSAVCGILICVLCCLLPVARKKKYRNHDEELADVGFLDPMNEHPRNVREPQKIPPRKKSSRDNPFPHDQVRDMVPSRNGNNAFEVDERDEFPLDTHDRGNPWGQSRLGDEHILNDEIAPPYEQARQNGASTPQFHTIDEPDRFYPKNHPPAVHHGTLVLAPDPSDHGDTDSETSSSYGNSRTNNYHEPKIYSSIPAGRTHNGDFIAPPSAGVESVGSIDGASELSHSSHSESSQSDGDFFHDHYHRPPVAFRPAPKRNSENINRLGRSAMDQAANNNRRYSEFNDRAERQRKLQEMRAQHAFNGPTPRRRDSSEPTKEERRRRSSKMRR